MARYSGLLGVIERALRRLKRLKRKVFDRRAHILRLVEPGQVCAEIGVWKGAFARKLLRRKPAKLHLIDPWLFLPQYEDRVYGKQGDNSQEHMDRLYEQVRQQFASHPNVVIHRTTSEQAAAEFADDYFDFVYIDGNHSYAFVKKDLECYLPKVKREGVIAGDDYIFRRCPNGGPKRAVKELQDEGKLILLSVKKNAYVLKRADAP